MRGSLFRQQALDHQRPTLIGNTLTAQPLSFRVMTALACGLAALVVLLGCFGEYTQKARVSGYLAPSSAPIEVYAPEIGTLTEKQVIEGQRVRRGDTLFVLSAESRRPVAITAPTDGTATSIRGERGLGAGPHVPLLSILPPGARLQALLLVPSRVIGTVRAGDAVRVRYRAFPYRQYGSFKGVITEVSKTLVAPAYIEAPVPISEPVYRVTVALDRQTVTAGGDAWPLQAGMQLDADVPLLRRRLIEWVLDPLLSAAREE